MNHSDRDLLLLHVWFLVIATAALIAPLPPSSTVTVALLVLLYNVVLPIYAVARGHRDWLGTWAFLLLVSTFQLLPDRFLAEVLGVLRFTTDATVPTWGSVPISMAGMWVIPLTLLTLIGRASSDRGRGWGHVNVAVASLVVFGLAEHLLPMVPIWRAVGVQTIGNAAVYILPAEVVLGVMTVATLRWVDGQPWLARIPAAAAITVTYLGAAATSWFLLERIA